MRSLIILVLVLASSAAHAQYALMTFDPYNGTPSVTIDPVEANTIEKATVQRLLDLGYTDVEVTTMCADEHGAMVESMTSTSSLSNELSQFMYEAEPLRGVVKDEKGRVVKYAYTAIDEDENYIDAVATVEYDDDGTVTVRGDETADPFEYICTVERDEKGRIVKIHEASERDINSFMEFEFTYDAQSKVTVMTITTEPSDVSNRTTRIERTFMDNGLIATEKVYGDCLLFTCGSVMITLTEEDDSDPYPEELFLQEERTYVYR